MADRLAVRDAILSFVPGEPLRAALFLTYSFDGRWFEEALVPDLCERPIDTMLVIRDRNAITSEAPSVRYRKANACRSAVFHPKLVLLVAEDRVRAIISSANLTRGGFERQRELGRVYDLSMETTAEHGFIAALVDYLEQGVSTELRGESVRALNEVTVALREVVEKYKPSTSSSSSHTLLHNYLEPIWPQLLTRLPHRVLRRAAVLSPFFEPDREKPEDPALSPDDSSIFARLLFEDFEFGSHKGETPVRVYFRQSEGRTELPIHKLRNLAGRATFFAQDEREQRLHAKLLLLEGAEGLGREPFLVALHGSPNFTTAGLLHRPPRGNSELAVLTALPAKRNGFSATISQLALGTGFHEVESLRSLTCIAGGSVPFPPPQGLADATFRLADGTLHVTLAESAPEGARIRVLLQRDGTWIVIGEGDVSEAAEISMPVTGLIETNHRTKLQELRGTTVRIEIVGSDGVILACDTGPLNVDVPREFCGLTLVGSALLTLDERIARAGINMLPTYREQQKWVEGRKAQDPSASGPAVTTHQADLDRFYRNVHRGLRGILARCKESPGSHFTVRRSIGELTGWSVEAISTETTLTRECSLFLVDRLLRAFRTLVEGTPVGMRPALVALTSELRTPERLAQVGAWLDTIKEPALSAYALVTKAEVRFLVHELATAKKVAK